MATLRSGAGIPCGFRATGNPGGPGHQWVSARYIDPAPGGWKIVEDKFQNPFTNESLTRERVFIPSKLTDNRYLGGDYVASLQMVGSKNLVRAWLEGDWSVIEGAFFPEFSESRHVVSPFRVPDDWLRFRSMDWGSAAPFSVGWWAVASENLPTTRKWPWLADITSRCSRSISRVVRSQPAQCRPETDCGGGGRWHPNP